MTRSDMGLVVFILGAGCFASLGMMFVFNRPGGYAMQAKAARATIVLTLLFALVGAAWLQQ